MESLAQPPPELKFRPEFGPQLVPEMGPKVPEKEPDYQCGICSKHFLLRSELILHAKEDHNQIRKSNNSYESSNKNLQKPSEPFEFNQQGTCENLQDAMDTKFIPNSTESASFCPKYSHMCPTCYQVFDYRIQLNCHMKVHQNSPETGQTSGQQFESTGPDRPKLVAAEKPKGTKISARPTTKRKATEENSETKLYFCPNSGCSFKSRWASSRWQHTRTCSKKIPKPDSLNAAAKQSPGNVAKKSMSSKSKTICYINSEKFYLCPNSSCNFKSRWASSRLQHTKTCSQKIQKPHAPSSVVKQSPKKICKQSTSSKGKKSSHKNSEGFHFCPNSGCSFKSRWLGNRSRHTKTCPLNGPERQPLNSDVKQSPEDIPKKSASSEGKKSSNYNSEEFHFCPNSGCSFKTLWRTNRYRHVKNCPLNGPERQSLNSDVKQSPEDVPKKSANSLRKKVSCKYSEKLYFCPNSGCNYKTRWRSNLCQHKKTCRNNSSNSALKKLVKKPAKLLAKRPVKVGRKPNKLVAKKPRQPVVKKEESEPQLVINSESKQFECSICGFRPTAIHNFNQHKATHLKYKPFVCRFPGCKFASRWEGNLRSHIWRRGHESARKAGRNLRQESPTNVQSLYMIQAPNIAKKAKEQKGKFQSTNRAGTSAKSSNSVVLKFSSPVAEESSVHIEESSNHIDESSIHIEESSDHIEESSIHIEESSIHIEESSIHIEESSIHIEDPPKLDSPFKVHPTLPLPSICHTSRRLRKNNADDSIHDESYSVHHEDPEEVQPIASTSKKQSSKMLEQVFNCPMADCTFTTRWEIGIAKHFDRFHSSSGTSISRSNKLYDQQQVDQHGSEMERLASTEMDATNGERNNEKENQISNNFETSEVECELKVGKNLSQPELVTENCQELPPEEVQGYSDPRTEVKCVVQTGAEAQGEVKPPKVVKCEVTPATEVEIEVKPVTEVKEKVRRSTRVVNEPKASTKEVKFLARRSSRVLTTLSSGQKDPLKEVIIKDTSETSDPKTRFKCPKCNYQGASRWHINRHMVTHGKDRPYPCPGCSMSFQSTGHLNIHRKKYPRCDLAQRHVESNQPKQRNAARSIKALSPPAPVKTLARQNHSLAQPSENSCVFCSYLSKLSKFMQKHVGKCPGCHKAVQVADVEYRIKKEIIFKREV